MNEWYNHRNCKWILIIILRTRIRKRKEIAKLMRVLPITSNWDFGAVKDINKFIIPSGQITKTKIINND